MTARIAGFVTRAQAGLRSPRSRSTNIDASRGGVALHYGGSGKAPSSHVGCVATWRGWQRYHMDSNGWADIAYSFGFCQHGFAFAGRGVGVRTAANGTNAGNDAYYAACWIGGAASQPSQAALDAAEWIVGEARRAGDAGRRVRAHLAFKSTACPGKYLAAHADRLDGASVAVPPTVPVEPGDRPLSRGDRGPDVAWLQRFLNIPDDGSYGPQTEAAVRDYQAARGLTVDGKCGPQTWASILEEDDMPTAQEIVNELLTRRIDDGGRGEKYTVEAYLVQTNLKVSKLVDQVRAIVAEAAAQGGTPDEIAERVAQRLAADPPKDEDPA